jgi:CubicO group peptidase (beta-lactamase class C family)
VPGRADDAIRQIRQANAGLAVTVIEAGRVDVRLSSGADAITAETLFEIGSVTKTLTALLLAQMTLAGEVSLETRIGDELPAGENGTMTLGQLATHTSGLPRLPQSLMAKARVTPQDPNVDYRAEDLVADLQAHRATPGAPEYSNYGFMVLGLVLSTIAGQPLGVLLAERVFAPLGMAGATFSAATDAPDRRVQGYRGNEAVPHWSKPLPGAGGVEASIEDISAYLGAHLDPASSPMQAALHMTQRPLQQYGACLGWHQAGSALCHNGGTCGFSTFVGFDRNAGRGVGILANMGNAGDVVDAAGVRALGGEPG